MASIADKVMAKTGKTRADLAKKNGKVGSIFRRAGVSDSPELSRIIDLPRRDWEVGLGGRFGTTEELVRLLTSTFKTDSGTQELWPVQAVSLAELHDFHGLAGLIRTAGGKTLTSFLAAAAVDLQPALLLVPAMMYDITKVKYKRLSEHWKLPELYIQTYNFLSQEQNKDWLSEFKPRIIIADEAQKLKNKSAACTMRVHWYMHDNPQTVFVPLSGTPFNRSLQEVAHLLQWALPKICPVPRDYGTLLEWSLCLDEEKTGVNALAPGKLVKLCNDDELALYKKDPLKATRMAFQRRLTETPGVVSVSDPGINIPLTIRGFDIDIDTEEVNFAFHDVRKRWTTPDGRPFAEAVKVWMYCRQLVCGFYYIWEPAPPKEWLKKRSAWCKDLRHILTYNNRRLATEFQVAKAIIQGLYDVPSYWEWVEIKDTYKYKKVAVWLHDVAIKHAAKWLKANPKGICWVEHEAFAKRLQEYTKLPYFGAGGTDASGRMIENASGPVIASVRANGVGRDLQYNWNKNLIISCAPNGEVWEQMIARTHRFGQPQNEVSFDVLLGCSEQYFGLQQAIRDADFAATMLKQPRKLLVADIQVEAIEDVAKKSSTRWQKMVKQG